MGAGFGMGFVILLFVLAVVLYFLPAVIASARKHPNATSILVMNFFLGWSGLGWIAALIWAFTSTARPEEPAGEPVWLKDEAVCPFCAETVKAAALVCKHCGRDLPKAGAELRRLPDPGY